MLCPPPGAVVLISPAMSARALPLLPSGRALAGLAVATGFLCGVTLAADPKIGVTVLAALAFGILILIDLPVGLGLWLVIVFFARLQFFWVAPLAGALAIGMAWLGRLRPARSALRTALHEQRGVVGLAALLAVWLVFASAYGTDPDRALAEIGYWLWALGTLVVVASAGATPQAVRVVAAAFVAGAAGSALLGLLAPEFVVTQASIDTPEILSGSRLGGAGDHPNDFALMAVAGIALAGGLLALTRGVGARATVLGGGLLLAVGLLSTASRGGFIAAMVAGAAVLVVFAGRRGRAGAVLLALLAVAAVWLASSPAALERVTTYEDRGTGRADLWLIATHMYADHPVLGVGLNRFETRAPDYVREAGALQYVEFVVDDPKEAHNIYLELLAETGPVGLLLFLALVGACLRAAWRAASRFDAAGEPRLSTFARAAVIAMIGMLTGLVFSSNAFDPRIWAVLGLGPALLAYANARHPYSLEGCGPPP